MWNKFYARAAYWPAPTFWLFRLFTKPSAKRAERLRAKALINQIKKHGSASLPKEDLLWLVAYLEGGKK